MTKTIQLGEPPMSYAPVIHRREIRVWEEVRRNDDSDPDKLSLRPKGFATDSTSKSADQADSTRRKTGFSDADSSAVQESYGSVSERNASSARAVAENGFASVVPLRFHADGVQQISNGQAAKLRPRHFGQVLYTSQSMDAVHRQLARVAATDATVFIIGQTGTGKELVARSIHTMSKRAKSGFLAVNCGAIAASLVESELFGHERGSFTGAQQVHKGHFERATGGTLLLDEITEMPIELQVKLLRVLETGRIMRVGGTKEIEVDVRVVAATNRDPMDAVKEGKLREDLMYRLSVFPLHIPALRDRGNESILLAEHFLRKLNREASTNKVFSEQAKGHISAYAWPGNVRELKNRVSRAFILADDVIGSELIPTIENIDMHLNPEAPTPDQLVPRAFAPVGTSLADVEKQLILQTLAENDGNKPHTAEMLGISLKTLYNRLNSYRGGEIQ